MAAFAYTRPDPFREVDHELWSAEDRAMTGAAVEDRPPGGRGGAHADPGGGSANHLSTWFRRVSFNSAQSLEKAIREYLEINSQDPQPFEWTADADLVLGKVQRLCERLYDSGR